MSLLIPEVRRLLDRADRLLTHFGKDYEDAPPHDSYVERRWTGENVEICLYPTRDFAIILLDRKERVYAVQWRNDRLHVEIDLVDEVNKRLGKITVLDDLADA